MQVYQAGVVEVYYPEEGEVDSEEFEEDGEEEEEGGDDSGGGDDKEEEEGAESITVTLIDPQVLDCKICCNPLTVPVYQCANGHVTCLMCCCRLENKCPFCRSRIGFSRCRAIENVLESVTVTCKNKAYGCSMTTSYSKKGRHETCCLHTPCSCPLSDCRFVGSSYQLNKHFRDLHEKYAVQFQFNKVSHITLNINEKFLVLQEENVGFLFILNNRPEKLGNVVSVSCITSEWMRNFFSYSLTKPDISGTPLRFQNYVDCIQNQVDNPPSEAFLLVPSTSFGSSGQLKLDLCIWR